MADYTANNGLTKPVPFTEVDTWGDVVNTNFDLIDQALDGISTISFAGTNTQTITLTDGVAATARARVLVVQDDPPGEVATLTIQPTDLQKTYFIVNKMGAALLVFQGAYVNYVIVPNGGTALVYCNGVDGVYDLLSGASLNVQDLMVTRGTQFDVPLAGNGAAYGLQLQVFNAAPTDANIPNSAVVPYLDEAGNNLKIRVRKSDGTYKTATIPLT